MNITDSQRAMLEEYGVPFCDDINELLLDLDAKITEIGFEADYEWLNPIGRKLQRLYDELYDQN